MQINKNVFSIRHSVMLRDWILAVCVSVDKELGEDGGWMESVLFFFQT